MEEPRPLGWSGRSPADRGVGHAARLDRPDERPLGIPRSGSHLSSFVTAWALSCLVFGVAMFLFVQGGWRLIPGRTAEDVASLAAGLAGCLALILGAVTAELAGLGLPRPSLAAGLLAGCLTFITVIWVAVGSGLPRVTGASLLLAALLAGPALLGFGVAVALGPDAQARQATAGGGDADVR